MKLRLPFTPMGGQVGQHSLHRQPPVCHACAEPLRRAITMPGFLGCPNPRCPLPRKVWIRDDGGTA